ncbi:MAG: hypothetical protein ACPGWR_05530 [Ardenticatenaceae bacterium]
MNIQRTITLLLILMFFAGAAINTVQAARPAQAPDYDIPNGHFFTQTANAVGGFTVVDDEQARFWSEFQRLGGLQTVGYPISRRFEQDGFVTQAFQKFVLQWRPEAGQAWPVNVFDELSKKGFDQTLLSTYQTPEIIISSEFDDPNASWEDVVFRRQELLNANEAIRARYFSVTDPLNVFGLPTSHVEYMGSHYAMRTQRALFQQWTEETPWAAKGEVTIANGGDIAKQLGWLPGDALEPEAMPAPSSDSSSPESGSSSAESNSRSAESSSQSPESGPQSPESGSSSPESGSQSPESGSQSPESGSQSTEISSPSDQNPSLSLQPPSFTKPWQLRTLLMGSGNPGRLYALLLSQDLEVDYRLMISDDYGDSWSAFHGGVPAFTFNIDIDYQKPDGLYAHTKNGIYEWTGNQWTHLSTHRTFDLTIPYGEPSTMWAVDFDRVFLRSNDWGRTWTPLSNNHNLLTVALDPRNNGTFYATSLQIGQASPLLMRGNAEGQWVGLPSPEGRPIGLGFSIDGQTGDLYTTTNGLAALWRSKNPIASNPNEVRWEQVYNFGSGIKIDLLASGSSPNGLALYLSHLPLHGTQRTQTLHRSLDSGQTWQKITYP